MDNAWKQRLEQLMADRGITPAELTRRAGVNSTMVHDILKRGQTPSIANLAKLASALGVRLIDILESNSETAPTIHLHGRVAGGDMWTDTNVASGQALTLNVLTQQLVSIAIETNDLQPLYRRGDVVCGPKSVGRHVDNHIGEDCIVRLTTGEQVIRTLHRGSSPGRYTLRSLNRNVEDIEGASVDWVAPIQMILRGQI